MSLFSCFIFFLSKVFIAKVCKEILMDQGLNGNRYVIFFVCFLQNIPLINQKKQNGNRS